MMSNPSIVSMALASPKRSIGCRLLARADGEDDLIAAAGAMAKIDKGEILAWAGAQR
jgi:hypothetical protein